MLTHYSLSAKLFSYKLSMNTTSDVERLFSTMMQLGKLMSQQTRETHEEKKATMLQFMALHYLKEQPNGTPSEIGRLLELSKSSATQLIERLVIAGFVKRVHDKEDRRNVRLKITESGEEEFIVLKKKMIGKMQRIFSKIPVKDLRELIRIQTNLVKALKNEQNG